MLKYIKLLKDFLLASRVFALFRPFQKGLGFLQNAALLSGFIAKNRRGLLINDFYRPVRDYSQRTALYKAVSDHYGLDVFPVRYLEFGVASGASFRWWLENNKAADSRFYGFDTFEGLPEDWALSYNKGHMAHPVPELNDARAAFYKGIFQDTLAPFIKEANSDLTAARKVIHMDADLFSSTIFSLSQLYPHLRKGDLIFFDEFSVPNHEYQAFRIFTAAFYVRLKLVGAVNNYYQVAFEVV